MAETDQRRVRFTSTRPRPWAGDAVLCMDFLAIPLSISKIFKKLYGDMDRKSDKNDGKLENSFKAFSKTTGTVIVSVVSLGLGYKFLRKAFFNHEEQINVREMLRKPETHILGGWAVLDGIISAIHEYRSKKDQDTGR